jgi:GTPase
VPFVVNESSVFEIAFVVDELRFLYAPVADAAQAVKMENGFRAGMVAIVGRPNVGKSTLLNRLVGQKISITSRRPQTTRHRILGIVTRAEVQFAFVDTPGLQARHGGRLGRAMNRAAAETLASVDAVVLVVEALRFGPEDKRVLAQMPPGAKVVLAINQVDRIGRRDLLLPFMQQCSHAYPFEAIVPLSAKTGQQTAALLDELGKLMPQAPPLYGENEITDRSERFLAAELIREKLFRLLGAEVPYATAVEIERFEVSAKGHDPGSHDPGSNDPGSPHADELRRIHAAILVDKPGQKAIVIGQGGAKLKEVATQARQEMEKLFGGRVFLEVWVKVKGGWMDDPAVLKRLGYD